MEPTTLVPGEIYINNLGSRVILMAIDIADCSRDAYQKGFDLVDKDGELYNNLGHPFSGDETKYIVMTKEAYDFFLEDSGLQNMVFDGIMLIDVLAMVEASMEEARLKVTLGGYYVNGDDAVIAINGLLLPEDESYGLGFRFLDSSGIAYTEDGKTGLLNGDLVFPYLESEGLILQDSRFYRNGLGDVVLIMSRVDPASSAYAQGFRAVDHRGTMYTASGSVNSRIWGKLDLHALVNHEDVTDEEIAKVHAQSDVYIRALDRADAVSSTISTAKQVAKKLAPLLLGSTFGLGVAAAMAS